LQKYSEGKTIVNLTRENVTKSEELIVIERILKKEIHQKQGFYIALYLSLMEQLQARLLYPQVSELAPELCWYLLRLLQELEPLTTSLCHHPKPDGYSAHK
jgi:hypothetical protein